MSKEQMLAARELIKNKQYDQARVILENIDHPKAKEWLMKLDGMAPSKSAAAVKPARPKAAPKPKPSIEDADPEEFLDELMARKRPAPKKRAAASSAKKRKKPGFRYFLVYGLIFIILLGGMLYAAYAFLGTDDSSDAEATADAVTTLNAEGLEDFNADSTAVAATANAVMTLNTEEIEEFDTESTAAAETLEAIGTPIPEVTEEAEE